MADQPTFTFNHGIKDAIILAQNPGLRNDINTNLKKIDIQTVKSTAAGRSVLEELNEKNIRADAIFIDMKLSDMSALQFAERLRGDGKWKNIHIFLLYSDEESADVIDALTFGLSGVFKKPFRTDMFQKDMVSRLGKFVLYKNNIECLFWDTTAKYFEGLDQLEDAKRYYEKITEIDTIPHNFFDLGRINQSLGRENEAKTLFDKAISLDPSYQPMILKYTANMAKTQSTQRRRPEAIPPTAIAAFSEPIDKYKKTFIGVEELQKAVIAGGTHEERIRLKSMLAFFQCKQVHISAQGKDAINQIKSNPSDAVFVFLNLADMNALQFIDLFHKAFPVTRTLLVLVVDDGRSENILNAFEMGIDGYIIKPLTSENVSMSLHRTMLLDLMAVESPKNQRLIKSIYFFNEINKIDEAIAAGEEALKQNDNDAVTYLYLAIAYHKKNKLSKAESMYDICADKNPKLKPLCEYSQAKANEDLAKRLAEEEADGLKKRKDDGMGGNFEDIQISESDFIADVAATPENRNKAKQERSEKLAIDIDPFSSPDGPLAKDTPKDDDFGLIFEDSDEESPNRLNEKEFERLAIDIDPAKADIFAKLDLNANLRLKDGSLDLGKKEAEGVAPTYKLEAVEGSQKNKLSFELENGEISQTGIDYSLSETEDLSNLGYSLVHENPKQNLEMTPAKLPPRLPAIQSGALLESRPSKIVPLKALQEEMGGGRHYSALSDFENESGLLQIELKHAIPKQAEKIIQKGVSQSSHNELVRNLSYGATPAHHPLQPMYEQVINNNGKIVQTGNGGSIFVIGEDISEWLPTAKLKEKSQELGVFLHKLGSMDDREKQGFEDAFTQMISQARLMNLRLHATMDKKDNPYQVADYFTALGQVFSAEAFFPEFEKILPVSPALKKQIIKAGKAQKDSVFKELGKTLLDTGVLDEFFSLGEKSSLWRAGEDPALILPYQQFFGDSMEKIAPALQKLHAEYYSSKTSFVQDLPYIISQIEENPKDLYSIIQTTMAKDHNSLESFKTIYASLHRKNLGKLKKNLAADMLKKNYKNPRIQKSLVDFFVSIGDYDASQDLLKSLISQAKNPELLVFLRKMSKLSYDHQKFKECVYWSQRILSLVKGDESAFNMIAVSYKKLNNLKKAVKFYKAGIKFNPTSYKLHYNLAITLANLGLPGQSFEYLEKSRKINESLGFIYPDPGKDGGTHAA